ncbi:unnamed protein product [Mytilus coruscus]|uniref:Uncharacterized protein n=1 Tax=Mytilus coruscus TaxID=42192 RepID=A0A6J8DPY1_MYTCO|nr:unnamed protein product [Mytilus coruscus]
MKNPVHHAASEHSGENALSHVIVVSVKENATSDVYAVTNENYIQTVVSQNTLETKEGLTERGIYVYSARFGGLFILIVSALSIFIYFNRHRSKQLQINQILEHNDNPVNDETLHESLYESIDESAICDANIEKSNPQESLEEDTILQSGSEVSSKSSGYLHPYTTFTKNNTTHLYCTQIKSDSSSTYS